MSQLYSMFIYLAHCIAVLYIYHILYSSYLDTMIVLPKCGHSSDYNYAIRSINDICLFTFYV